MQKTALITGAARGMGRQIAKALANDAYYIIALGRNIEKHQELEKEIRKESVNCAGFKFYDADLRNKCRLDEALEQIINENGRIDVLVNNAGIYKPDGYQQDAKNVRAVLEVNVEAVFQICRHIVPLMKEQGGGYIFNIASRAGKIGFPASGLYVASKFALVGFSESLYRELSPHNIKVTAICPSFVNTEMAREAGSDADANQMIQQEDIAGTIRYLLRLSPAAVVKEVVIECRQMIH